ncbi:MAG: hypothetical protein RQ899_00605 [Pseudomonadales bacterium]|nr:hypothetical protein [Pseudomonadales bacterium]
MFRLGPRHCSKLIALFIPLNCSLAQDPGTLAEADPDAGVFGGGQYIPGIPTEGVLETLIREVMSDPAPDFSDRVITFGYEVPEALAREMAVLTSGTLIADFDARDQALIVTAHEKISDNKQRETRLLHEQGCRTLMNSSDSIENLALWLAELIMDVERRTGTFVVAGYDDLLASLSPAAATALEEHKDRTHAGMSSNTANWLVWSRKDPDGLISNWRSNCRFQDQMK